MIARIFRAHGQFCSSHPWEVMITTLILTIYILSTCGPINEKKYCTAPLELNNVDAGHPAQTEVVLMTLARCMSLLCIYNQFKNLYRQQSTYILSVAVIFIFFSSIVYSCSVLYMLDGVVLDLSKALPFFLLMTDLAKVGSLTRVALSSTTQQEVRSNIALGMSELGPALTLDTVVGTLAIGIGTLSGVKSLEDMSCYTCLSVIVNYFIFITFLPSCLSLALELGKGRRKEILTHEKLHDKEQKLNPALQRVKVIMSAGLVLVHAHCRWMLPPDDNTVLGAVGNNLDPNARSNSKELDMENLDGYLYKWFNIEPDQVVMLGLTFALVIRYVFYENQETLSSLVNTNVTETVKKEPRLRVNSNNCEAKENQPGLSSAGINDLVNASFKDMYRRTQTISFVVGGEPEQTSKETCSVEVQTECSSYSTKACCQNEKTVKTEKVVEEIVKTEVRKLEECAKLYKEGNVDNLNDEEVAQLVKAKHIQAYKLEVATKDCNRGVSIRRKLLSEKIQREDAINDLPHENYNYDKVAGACCENVVGYMPVPVGVAGPMLLDNVNYHVPMATTEGCLVASVNRGFRALVNSGGIRSSVVADGMSRAPVVRFPSAQRAAETMNWLKKHENFQILKSKFDSTSRFARLQKLHVRIAGRYLFIRFVAKTGDAMGMNMLSKGTEASLETLQLHFHDMEILSLSGNYCSDKKPAAINWIEGRGKSVVCEAVVPESVVKSVLKTNVQSLIDVNISKNLIGSAIAGSIGGFNAQAANIVSAIFIATGQDPAQVVTSSNCMTLMEPAGQNGEDLYITVTMPSIEIGTIGGGTILSAQSACLKMLNVDGCKADSPGQNSVILAAVVCGAVLAGELSLISALSAGHLVRSHMRLNRSQSGSSGDKNNSVKKPEEPS